jgi:hypothetical protein
VLHHLTSHMIHSVIKRQPSVEYASATTECIGGGATTSVVPLTGVSATATASKSSTNAHWHRTCAPAPAGSLIHCKEINCRTLQSITDSEPRWISQHSRQACIGCFVIHPNLTAALRHIKQSSSIAVPGQCRASFVNSSIYRLHNGRSLLLLRHVLSASSWQQQCQYRVPQWHLLGPLGPMPLQ